MHVEGELDLAGVATGHPRRDRDLRGSRFFDVDTSPVLRFRAGPARSDGDGRWLLPGSLTLKGVECRLEVVVEVLGSVGDAVRVRATTTLDRRDVGIRVPRLLVGSVVEVTVDAELVPSPARR